MSFQQQTNINFNHLLTIKSNFMKKFTLTILALLLSFGAFAQVNFGVKVGANASAITNSDASTKIGLNVGGFVEFNIHKNFAIQAELLYSMQRASLSDGLNDYTFHYINLPILAKIKLQKFSILVGPQFGYAVEARGAIRAFSASDRFNFDLYERFDVSLAFGVGYDFYRNLGVEVRYNLGLTEMFAGSDVKNGDLQLGLTYKF